MAHKACLGYLRSLKTTILDFLKFNRIGMMYSRASPRSSSHLAPVITTFPETNINSTTLGEGMRNTRPANSSGSYVHMDEWA